MLSGQETERGTGRALKGDEDMCAGCEEVAKGSAGSSLCATCLPARMSATLTRNSVAISGGISCCVVQTNARSPLCRARASATSELPALGSSWGPLGLGARAPRRGRCSATVSSARSESAMIMMREGGSDSVGRR